MKLRLTLMLLISLFGLSVRGADKPWAHGALRASDNGLFLQHEDGTPFFWLGETGWLMPQRLDRDEAEHYLRKTAEEGFNVVQVQTINGVPSFNVYGRMSHPDGWNLDAASKPGEYGYWEHMDHIIDAAERNGIYIGMVCIWGGLVKSGKMTEEQAVKYGKFLADRYKDKPNIIWIIGGDIQGDIKTKEWDALARSIKTNDNGTAGGHIMTFHPRGRTTSARWFADRDWIDFHMFQSGHRRYGQRMGNKDYPIPDDTEEDSWMYVDSVRKYSPVKPVLDGEPSYENIPQGLHFADEPVWNDKDVRRYAYWSVFRGACGHTYGHNNIMQFSRPGIPGAYFANGIEKPWYVAIDDPGRKQMKYLKRLIQSFPYFDRMGDQSIVLENGVKYDRILATRGHDYLMAYNHTGRPMKLDLSKISGTEKNVWTMDPTNGSLTYLGKTKDRTYSYTPIPGNDLVLIAADANTSYLTPQTKEIPEKKLREKKDLTE